MRPQQVSCTSAIYDPSTGRFLTRHAKPDNTNPYVPWNPSSALFAPLALLFLLYGNKRKRSKWDTLVIMLLLGVAVTMSLAACGNLSASARARPGKMAWAGNRKRWRC
jgi:hypothetical protein